MPYTISFPDTHYSPLTCDTHTPAQILTVQNSPVLFGCRTGLCGTCVVEVSGSVLPPDAAEQEILALYATDWPQARLACQLQIQGDVEIRRPA